MTPSKDIVLLAGTANAPFARRLAKELKQPLGTAEVITFSDQETHVVIKEKLKGKDIYLVQPTSMPANKTLMELLIMAHAVKGQRPKRITAVMPFFGYRRQEKLTRPGESLTFQLVAKLLKTAGVDRVLVIDLHKHRSVRFFKEANVTCKELRAFEVVVEYFKKKKLENFVVLAPDKGGIPEAERYASALGVPLVKAYKHRTKVDQVTFDRMEGEVEGKNVLITDDEINTAGTLMGVVDILKKKKAHNIYFACTHGVLSGPAIQRLAQSRIKQIVITDSIYLPPKKRLKKIKVLSVAPLFAETIAQWARK